MHSPRKDQVSESTRRFVWLLDNQFRLPLTRFRFGLDPLIGLVPGIGDFAGALLSCVVLVSAWRMRVGPGTLVVIFLNILLDHLVGTVPVIGDLFDAVFKVNQRNLGLLERHLQNPVATAGESRQRLTFLVVLLGVLILVLLATMALAAWLVIRIVSGLLAR